MLTIAAVCHRNESQLHLQSNARQLESPSWNCWHIVYVLWRHISSSTSASAYLRGRGEALGLTEGRLPPSSCEDCRHTCQLHNHPWDEFFTAWNQWPKNIDTNGRSACVIIKKARRARVLARWTPHVSFGNVKVKTAWRSLRSNKWSDKCSIVYLTSSIKPEPILDLLRQLFERQGEEKRIQRITFLNNLAWEDDHEPNTQPRTCIRPNHAYKMRESLPRSISSADPPCKEYFSSPRGPDSQFHWPEVRFNGSCSIPDEAIGNQQTKYLADCTGRTNWPSFFRTGSKEALAKKRLKEDRAFPEWNSFTNIVSVQYIPPE